MDGWMDGCVCGVCVVCGWFEQPHLAPGQVCMPEVYWLINAHAHTRPLFSNVILNVKLQGGLNLVQSFDETAQ